LQDSCPEETTHSANLNIIKTKNLKLIKLIGQRQRMMSFLSLSKKMVLETGTKSLATLIKNKFQIETVNNAERGGLIF
jgi:hypothetical protein